MSVFAGVDFWGFFPQGGGRRGDDGKGDGILASGGLCLGKSGSAASADGCCGCLKHCHQHRLSFLLQPLR